MPIKIIRIESTPNPNARKLIVEPTAGSIRSYFRAEDAQDDPLAKALFGIEEITNVLIHTKFISVCAKPGSDWKALSKSLKSTLETINESA